jgi:hypothetical protein
MLEHDKIAPGDLTDQAITEGAVTRGNRAQRIRLIGSPNRSVGKANR